MNVLDLLSVIVSALAILFVIGTLVFTAKKGKESKSIAVVKDHTKIIDKVLSAKPSYINLMGVTLKNFLFQTQLQQFIIANPSCKLRILLLDPDSTAANQFHLQESRFGFKLEVRSSIDKLNSIFSDKHNVEVRLYRDFPSTFLLVTEGMCAMQPYIPPLIRRISIYNAPMLFFTPNTPESKDICESLKMSFDHTWNALEHQISAP